MEDAILDGMLGKVDAFIKDVALKGKRAHGYDTFHDVETLHASKVVWGMLYFNYYSCSCGDQDYSLYLGDTVLYTNTHGVRG